MPDQYEVRLHFEPILQLGGRGRMPAPDTEFHSPVDGAVIRVYQDSVPLRNEDGTPAQGREMMLRLSCSMCATRILRKPDQAGGGLVVATNPALPWVEAPARTCSRRTWNDVCQPGLKAEMRSVRSSNAGSGWGR
jgi:hypothetical protein